MSIEISSQTVTQAKAFLREKFRDGARCPCCDQFVKKYKRKMGAQQAIGLIKLYKLTENAEPQTGSMKTPNYFHIRSIFDFHPGDFAKLLAWDLIQQMGNSDKTKSSSGYWAITEKGKLFVQDRITRPKFVYSYNAKFLGFDGPEISIKEALTEQFNYDELMSN